MSGRTVVDHINDLLLSEAKILLKSTGLNIVQIADRLHFAETVQERVVTNMGISHFSIITVNYEAYWRKSAKFVP